MKREEPKPRAVSAKIESRTKPLNIRPKEPVSQVPSYTPVTKNQSPSSYNQYNVVNYNPVSNHPVSNHHNPIYNRENLYTPHSNDYRNAYRPSTNINDEIYKQRAKK